MYFGKGWNELSVIKCEEYLEYLIRVNVHKKLSPSNLNQKVKVIYRFLNFLGERNIIDQECISPFKKYLDNRIFARNGQKKKISEGKMNSVKIPRIISDFLIFLQNNDYRSVNQYKKRILSFEKFLGVNGANIDLFLEEGKEDFLFDQIEKYENMISSRVSNEEITLATATRDLNIIKLFVNFLYSKKLIRKKYTIPIYLRGRSKRDNAYVPKQKMIELMNTIYDYSHHVKRDLSIFLIIVDTGCRPIEISNLKFRDIDTIERTLSFECGKTERRKVKISTEVMSVIKDYLQIRNNYNPKTDNLFINCKGEPITSSYINFIFYSANLKAFGESLYPAKAFRHTYITNALEEYSFERVSKAIGHKDWKSTYYYYNRSTKRLLANTLSKNPL
ncbi:tyrosine-type recombinase/integrase [Robertmurraya siralis]|uniref:tyrosine-type recombinase/integrase n=1 Tax=Robertmurraya siralis TaxID=77777 RepID=UPI0010F4B6AD|nr:site-specific integrase [Robertmurraya siralis]